MTPPKNETPEQRRQRLDRNIAKRRKKESEETPEHKRQRLDRIKVIRRKNEFEETPEKRCKRLEKIRERRRRRECLETPHKREHRLNGMRVRRERRERKQILEGKQAPKTRLEKSEKPPLNGRPKRKHCTKNPGTLEDIREKQRFYRLMRSISMSDEEKQEERRKMYFYRQANKERWSWANLSEEKRKIKIERHKLWAESLTGDKKQRHLESVQRALKKSAKKIYERTKQDPVKWADYLRKQRERLASETPAETLKRRRKDAINHAKRRLKMKLEEEDASLEEIKLQLSELGERMWTEFYPEGDVPIPGSGRRGWSRKAKVEAVPAGIQVMSTNEQFNAFLESFDYLDKPETYSYAVEECSGTPPVSAPVAPPFLEVSGPPTPIASPPFSPSMDMFEEEEVGCVTTTIPLPCFHCPFMLSSNEHLKSHILSCHSEKCWKCPKCEKVVVSTQELSQHYFSQHERFSFQNNAKAVSLKETCKLNNNHGSYICLKCPPGHLQKFGTREDLFGHVKQRHAKNYWPCLHCQLLKYSKNSLGVHQRICQSSTQL